MDSSSRVWTSTGLATLPTSLKAFDTIIEEEIISRLLEDLNNYLALDLLPNPSYNRLVTERDIVIRDTTTYILVGGSHARRTADGFARQGKRAIAATIAGW